MMRFAVAAAICGAVAAQVQPSVPGMQAQAPQAPLGIEDMLQDSNSRSSRVPLQSNMNSQPYGQPYGQVPSSMGTQSGYQSQNSMNQAPQMPTSGGLASQGVGGVMSSLLSSAASGGNRGSAGAVESLKSKQIVSGLVEAFMHKVSLQPGEKACLEQSVAQVTADAVGAIEDAIDAIKSLVGGGVGQPGARPIGGSQKGNLVQEGIDGAMKIASLVTLSTTLAKNCVQGDALQLLNTTAHNLINMKYIGHRLLVSGVDIAHCLSDSILAYEKGHFHRFGTDLGTTLRKVLLSTSTAGARLPEGVPEEDIIQETSEGIMDGFFAIGSSVEITDAARPDVDIALDLHACIAGNQLFFKEVFLAIWSAIAQMAANGEQHGLAPANNTNPFAPGGQTPKWTGELMIALMQLPMALQRCNIGEDTQSMLLEAIQTLGQLRVHVEFPAANFHHNRLEEITQRMALAVERWTNWQFKEFGKQIGVMLREFVLLVYPQRYSVDANGRLRRQLSGTLSKAGQGITLSFFSFLVLGVTFSVLLGLVAIRGLRSAAAPGRCEEESDVESAQFIEVETVE